MTDAEFIAAMSDCQARAQLFNAERLAEERVYLECRRQAEEDRVRVERDLARHKATQAALIVVMDLYIAQITAPWQALAEHIRAMDRA
jgi:hypothetical protein